MSIEDGLADIRRLYRSGRRATVALVSLARLAATPRHPAFYHYLRNSLEELAGRLEGGFHPLAEDSYLLWTTRPSGELMAQLAVILDIEENAEEAPPWQGSVETFALPGEHERLRATLQRLADRPRHPAAPGRCLEGSPRPALASPAAGFPEPPGSPPPPRGALTPSTLREAERILDGAELGRFLRRQQVCLLGARLETVYVEVFTSIPELGRGLFPDLALDPGTPLFPALLAHIDRLLLVELLLTRPFHRHPVGINLSLSALDTPEFARFDRAISPDLRGRIVIELHWLDWLRDLESGDGRIAALRRSGYRVAVDRLVPGPAMAALRPALLDTDFYKLVWSEAAAERLAAPGFAALLEPVAADRLVLTNCDRREALEIGASLSIRRYQGWLIDRLVREAACPLPALSRQGSAA